MEPILQSQTQTSKALENISLSLNIFAQSLLANFRIDIENVLSPALKDFLESIQQLPEQTQIAIHSYLFAYFYSFS